MNKAIGKPYLLSENRTKEITNNFFKSFSNIHKRMLVNNALFNGTSEVSAFLSHSNCKVITPIAKTYYNKFESLLHSMKRMPFIQKNSYKINDAIIEQINEILIHTYEKSFLQKELFNAFKDFMVLGIGVLEIVPCNNEIKVQSVSPLNIAFNFNASDEKYPSFLAKESIMTASDAIDYFEIDAKEPKLFQALNANMENCTFTISENMFFNILQKETKKDDYKTINKESVDILASRIETKQVLKAVPTNSLVVRQEYRKINYKLDNKTIYGYECKIYFNDITVKNFRIQQEEFQFTILVNKNKNSNRAENLFQSWFNLAQSSVIKYNFAQNEILDHYYSASSKGLLVADANALQNMQNKDVNNDILKKNILKFNKDNDNKISDSLFSVPATPLPQDYFQILDSCKEEIQETLGLLSFSFDQIKSGYQETLRLDKQQSSISHFLAFLDELIMSVGFSITSFIIKIMKNQPESIKNLAKDEEKFLKVADNIKNNFSYIKELLKNITITESKETTTYKMKIFNDIQTLGQITGQPLNISTEDLAELLGMVEVKEILQKYNAPNTQMEEIAMTEKVLENEEKKSVIEKNRAQAEKLKAETTEKLKPEQKK